MRTHSEKYKIAINKFGRQLDSKITFGETVLGNEQLNAVTPVLQSELLKSVMKEIDIDSNVEIPVGTILNYKFGVLLEDGEYEYVDYGNYQVYSIDKQEDTNSYNIVAYDKMLNAMVDYAELKDKSKQFPMMVRDYIEAICNDMNITFADKNNEFANYDKMVDSDLYSNLGYTYRDILDELAQVTASSIVINDNDELTIKYVEDTGDIINEEFLKDINVKFGEKYGPVNSIVLSRAEESDNIYLQDEDSIEKNGLHELRISDNQIMNSNNRDIFLKDILEKLDGLEFYINDFTSTGITYYEVLDRYGVQIGDKIYTCVMFNDQTNVTQGIEEQIHADMPEEAETDYTKSDKTDRRLNQTTLIVDKQLGEINATVSNYGDVLEEVQGQVNSQGATLNVITTNIDPITGEVTSVRTVNGFTFNKDGLNISTSENSFNTQITNEKVQHRNSNEVITETSKDGFMTNNMYMRTINAYSWDGNDYGFIDERIEVDGEYGYATFYNRND